MKAPFTDLLDRIHQAVGLPVEAMREDAPTSRTSQDAQQRLYDAELARRVQAQFIPKDRTVK